MLKEQLDRLTDESTLEGMAVLMYELGDLAKMVFYRHSYKEPSYMIEGKIALSDLIAQCILVCEKEGWDFEEVKTLGIERFMEKVQLHIDKGE